MRARRLDAPHAPSPSLENAAQGLDLSQVPAHGPKGPLPHARFSGNRAGVVQAKLVVGAIDDPLEREADRVADRVMDSHSGVEPTASATQVQRACAACEARKEEATDESGHADTVVRRAVAGSGTPLSSAGRAFMEPRLGRDLGEVRVHTGTEAAESAAALGARAYTVGRDIVFGAGQYAPDTREGRHLLAHELTHIMQQRGDELVQRAPTKEEAKQAKLRRLGVFPGEALSQWRTLSKADQDAVSWWIFSNYGSDFASAFANYASGKRKPDIGRTITNDADRTPAKLETAGYRRAATQTDLWVHPSGRELQVLSGSQKAQEPKSEEVDPLREQTDLSARCGEPCRDESEDEESCNECCETRIPESDGPCRRNCNAACSTKL